MALLPFSRTNRPGPWTLVNSFLNGWVKFNTGEANVAYRKLNDGDNVQIVGAVQSGSLGTAAFNLPVGFRPTANHNFQAAAQAIQITTAGDVIPTSGAGVFYLDGIICPLSGT